MTLRHQAKAIWLILIIVSLAISARANTSPVDSTVITILIKPKTTTGFFYYDKNYVHKILLFKNSSDAIANVTQKIFLDKPTLFEHIASHKFGDKKIETQQYFFLNPSSNTHWVLKDDYDLASTDTTRLPFIEAVDSLYLPFGKFEETKFDLKEKLSAYLKQIETDYKKNIDLTNKLFSDNRISQDQCNHWKLAFECKFFSQFFSALTNNNQLAIPTKNIVDEKLKTFISKLPSFQEMRFRGLIDVERAILYYISSGNYKDNFEQITTFALDSLDETSTTILVEIMKSIPEIGSNRYKSAVEKIRKKANPFEIQQINFITSTELGSTERYIIENSSRSIKTLKSLLDDNKGKLIYLDFWASWCVPCRAEIPVLKEIEEKYKGKPIVFISISLDEDNKVTDWANALKAEKLIGRNNQYRLITPKSSILLRIINLTSVPKYVMLDKEGKILNKEFLRPSDKEFENELNRYLKDF